MYKKLLYSAPEAELLVVKFEENFLQSGPLTTDGSKFDENAEVDDHSNENWW